MSSTSSATSTSLSAAQLALLNGTSSSSGAANSGGASASSAQSIQNEFLTLLTTQLKNQDPMNPMDSSQMTSQLAQISTVSGVQQLNTTMQSLITSNTAAEAAQAAALIGRTVVGSGTSFNLPASGGSTLGVNLAAAADTVTVNVSNANGAIVRSFSLGAQQAGAVSVPWDGKTSSGSDAPAGDYNISVTASVGGKAVTATPLVEGKVTAVTSNSSGVNLDVAGVGTIALSSVTQID